VEWNETWVLAPQQEIIGDQSYRRLWKGVAWQKNSGPKTSWS